MENREKMGHNAAVIVAGGSGNRFGGDKLMAELAGMPVLAHSMRAFEQAEEIAEIVVVARADSVETVQALGEQHGISKLARVVPGGATRAGSCLAGVMAVSEAAGVIAIHDGARPLVTERVICRTLERARETSAAIPAIPVKDTIKRAEAGVVTDTPARAGLFAVQTPQCFAADLIRRALADAAENAPEVTDDSMAVERVGGRIYLCDGDEENIKITTPLDLLLAEAIMARRESK